MKQGFHKLYEFFDKLPLCYLLTSAIGWQRTGCFYCPTFPDSFPSSFVNAPPSLAPSCLLTFLSLLPSFLSSLNCIFSFYTATSLSLLPLPLLLTFIPFSPPSCSLHPSYHFWLVHLIIFHLLSTLETPRDYPSFPKSICFLHCSPSSPSSLQEHHLSTFIIHPQSLWKEKSESSSSDHFLLLHHLSFCLLLLFIFSTVDYLSSVSTSSSPPISPLYLSLHSEFLLANCSDVEAHRSSPLMLTLLHDSCWRNPTGTPKTGGAQEERQRQRKREG